MHDPQIQQLKTNILLCSQFLKKFFWTQKSLQTVTAAMKLKNALSKKTYDKSRQHVKKQRYHFAHKGLYSQSYGFSSSHI